MREFIYEVPPADDGMLLQDYLKCRQGYSRRLIIDLKKSGISVNGEHRRMVDPVRGGDIIRIVLGELDETNLIPNPDLRADILYEDEDVVAFDKPADMSVHPCALYYNDTLGNLFAARYPGLTFRPLYRLDRIPPGSVFRQRIPLPLLC